MSKKKPLTIMFDIDGVLCDFIWGYTSLGAMMYGTPSIHTYDQQTWDGFPGLDEAKQHDVWDAIMQSNYFWQSLPPLVNALEIAQIGALYGDTRVQIYYVTNRLGLNVRQQTEAWLRSHLGIPVWANPSVIIARSKGDVARAVMADFAIDDKAENAWCIGWLTTPQNSKTPDCRSYLLDRPYNQYESKVGSSKIKRVATVQEYLGAIQEKLNG